MKNDNNTTIVNNKPLPQRVAIYVCLPFPATKKDLSNKVRELKKYCKAKGWEVYKTISEIGSGIDPQRKGLQKILKDDAINVLIVDTKISLSRYGFEYIETLLNQRGCTIKVKSTSILSERQLFFNDGVTLVFSYCNRYASTYRAAAIAAKVTTLIKKEIDDV